MKITKRIRREFTYQSKSDPSRYYTTLLYEDGSTSCNCPGWTRRVDKATGERSCKHVVQVERIDLRFQKAQTQVVRELYQREEKRQEEKKRERKPVPQTIILTNPRRVFDLGDDE